MDARFVSIWSVCSVVLCMKTEQSTVNTVDSLLSTIQYPDATTPPPQLSAWLALNGNLWPNGYAKEMHNLRERGHRLKT